MQKIIEWKSKYNNWMTDKLSSIEIRVRDWIGVEESEKRKCGGKEVIIEFVLMVVAVAVGYIFRDELKSLVSTLGTSVSTKISAMFNAA